MTPSAYCNWVRRHLSPDHDEITAPESILIQMATYPMSDANPLSRQPWLEAAVKHATPEFNKHGYTVPQVRISCGFPSTGQQ